LDYAVFSQTLDLEWFILNQSTQLQQATNCLTRIYAHKPRVSGHWSSARVAYYWEV